jgi:IstB-like ATP binding protein
MMGKLKLYGMKNAAVKRKHEPQRFVGGLLKGEISEKQVRSIKYALTIAKLPLTKDIDDFTYKGRRSTKPRARSGWRQLHRSLWAVGSA